MHQLKNIIVIYISTSLILHKTSSTKSIRTPGMQGHMR